MFNRVFVLTDGVTNDSAAVLDCIKNQCIQNPKTKIFSFGIGGGADKNLVTKMAEYGNGCHYFAADGTL